MTKLDWDLVRSIRDQERAKRVCCEVIKRAALKREEIREWQRLADLGQTPAWTIGGKDSPFYQEQSNG